MKKVDQLVQLLENQSTLGGAYNPPIQRVYTKEEQPLKDKIRKEVDAAVVKGNVILKREGKELLPRIGIDFSLEGVTAGRGFPEENGIAINLDMAKIPANQKKFLAMIPGHEIAHLVAMKLGSNYKHTKLWHDICKEMGVDDAEGHMFEVPGTYIYTCGCKGRVHSIDRDEHEDGGKQGKLGCTVCNQRMKWTGKVAGE